MAYYSKHRKPSPQAGKYTMHAFVPGTRDNRALETDHSEGHSWRRRCR